MFAAVAEIVTISLGGTVVSSAFWYFMLAVLVIALSLTAYLFLYKLVSSRRYLLRFAQERMVLMSLYVLNSEKRY